VKYTDFAMLLNSCQRKKRFSAHLVDRALPPARRSASKNSVIPT